MKEFDDPGMVQFRLGSLVRQLSVPEFRVELGLYKKEFMDDDDFASLHHHIHYSLSKCWRALIPTSATYDPSHSKASDLAPTLRYLQAILAHTLTGIARGYVFNLTYFIALAIRHQTEQHRKGVISIGPYVTRLAWYFGLLNMAAQASSITLISQKHLKYAAYEDDRATRGFDPLQYLLVQSAEQEDP
ncbi:hypothetical protein PVK06_008198 [Gossypium arboreum]|uniref:Uncharacterized protein n=1 Tax=Gossypium arboreum TaxID=29729 RepID=A0ABR0QJI3_GOSAR|nr:hypothetical protein PVK06_008198 [Gossypium arboreum]